jgi:hypothetical protein
MVRQRGRRVTFRVRKAMFGLLSDLAGSMGSNLAAVCQVFILTGSIFEYIQFEDAERVGQFASAVQRSRLAYTVDDKNPMKGILMSLSRIQSVLLTGPRRNSPHIEGSELVKVRLPPSFVHRIDLYAKLTKASRSAILTRFFVRGLLLYMRSQRTFMRAVVEAMRNQEPDPSTKTREPNPVEST